MIPFQWLVSWMIAAAIHEICHFVAIRICGLSVRYVVIGGFGAVIHMDSHPGRKLAVCSLAGPLGGLMLMLLVRVIPRIALCALVQSMYNLLPIYPLDGGQALAGLLTIFFSPKVIDIILPVVKYTVIGLLIVAAMYAYIVLELGLLPIIFVAALIMKNKNIPCKPMPLRVQ